MTPPTRLHGPVLGIETSCDETAAAILAPDGTVLAERLLSQTFEHAAWQGVVPEIAARAHLAHLPAMVAEVLSAAGLAGNDLGAVAATVGPGLIGGLLVGSGFAKGFALAAGKPFVAVNHLAAHALVARLPGVAQGSFPPRGGPIAPERMRPVPPPPQAGEGGGGSCREGVAEAEECVPARQPPPQPSPACGGAGSSAMCDGPAPREGAGGGPAFPYLLLLVSGGHTLLARVEAVDRFVMMGETIDDAAGECFDKCARALGLGWPGGPALERLAATGTPRGVPVPVPMRGRPGCDFSFSGLKTAVAQQAAKGAYRRQDLAAATQRAIAAALADRAANAMAASADCRALVVAGGVAANGSVRAALTQAASRAGFTLIAPPVRLCTDNAVMVAWAAIERLRAGLPPDALDAAENPRLALAG